MKDRVTEKTAEDYMRLALKEAEKARAIDEVPVGAVEAHLVDVHDVERRLRDLLGDHAVVADLRVVADSPEHPVRETRRAAASLRHFGRALLLQFHLEHLGGVKQDGLQFLVRVVLEPVDQAEAVHTVRYGVPGFFGSVLDYGTILVQTAAGDLVLSMVSHPETVYNEIENARHDAQPQE